MSQVTDASPGVAVLIPCYNEAATIEKVVRDFRAALPEATIYVFDNNSDDGTGDIARRAGAIVHTEKRQGKGFVVAAMFEKIEADTYLMADGDDTYPADRAAEMIAPVVAGEADMVVGCREAVDEAAAYRRFHVFGNWLVRKLINLIFGANLRDIMSGYRAFSREVALNLPIMAYGFDIETEMSIQCLYRRWVIREIPVEYRERPEGSESKLSTFRDGFRVLFRILSLFRSYKPLTFFGGMGIFFLVLSVVGGLTIWMREWPVGSGVRLALMITSATLMAMSLIAASIGLIVQLINFRFLELDSVTKRHRVRMERGVRRGKDPT
ncbi:MAG: glycosyltransferase [Phycisphaerales bacterium]|nr:glycosyltransferase [Phycisphaerales bacterium]MCB9862640.1 glycosyltransferase [Phycisphaerales bacterium]